MTNRYGPIALAVWFGIFFSSIGGFVAAMELGLDIDGFVGWMVRTFGMDEERWVGVTAGTGKLAVAYGLTQLIKPLRIALFLVLTPVVAGVFGRKPADPAAGPSGDGDAAGEDGSSREDPGAGPAGGGS
jgi:hypothetical protein